jgi:hypothetical protein
VIEMVRKFILTSAVIFFNEGSSMQVATAVLVSMFFLVLHVCYLPFADSSDNWLQGLALVALVLVYFIGLLIKVQPQKNNVDSLDALLQAVSAVVAIIGIAVPFYQMVKKLRQHENCFENEEEDEEDGFARARDPLLTSKKGDTFLLAASSNREGFHSRGGLDSGTSGSVSRDGLRSREAVPDELQAARSLRAAAEAQFRECQQELQVSNTERAALQEQLRCEREVAGREREAVREECTALREQLRQAGQQQATVATDHPSQRGELGADAAAAAAAAILQGRRFFDTQQSVGLRAADPNALVGKTIEVGGETGVVKAVVANTGGSTLHTVDFGGGKVETIHLAKRAGGKGAKFHVAGEGEGASGGGISYHAAATPERNQSRLAHRAGQPSGAK